MRNEVEARVHFSGGATFSEEGNQYTSEFKAAEAYQYAYGFYDDTANEDDKSKRTQIYSLRSPTPPLLPPRGTTGTRPDLVSNTFPDDDDEIYEGFDYVQVVKEYDPKYSGQHSLKVGDVYRIQNPLLDGDDDGFYRSIEGKLIPKDNVKIFQKKPIPTPKKRTIFPHEDTGYTQIPKPDKQLPPSEKSQQNDTGKTSDRELLMNLLEANRKILESQDEIKSSLAEHQKILNVVCETPVYQEYYNSTQTGGCQLPQTEDVYEMCKDENDELYSQAEPDVPALDDGGEESDHYVEADADGNLTIKTMSNFKNIRL
ncbi:uncharacterized protein LOC128239315 [Mya arenaria]|uniref:uncharacterized protein LOC128239315 n=1 Tax=Mya arenaria TaxID=6604 RepID=UPI0022E5846C|nr:uncharacterized protein LOC128239315 [Mya arenaria]